MGDPIYVLLTTAIAHRMSARETLIAELREHALVIGEVTLTSGATASYYVDAKRAILRQPGSARSASSSPPRRTSAARPPSAA